MLGPLVSIVMPAYKARDTIASAAMSVLNQRYKSWELIIVDDGSPDNMRPEIDQFDDKRIRYCRLPENKGLSNALNVGIEMARGRYVARMDSDDFMEEWRIGDQVQHLMLEDLALCGTGADKFGLEKGRICNPGKGPDILNSFLMGNPFVHPTIMFDREKIGSNIRYNADFRCEEDYELWSRVITSTNCENIDYSTLRYRVSAGSNANHPQKKRLNLIVLRQFSERMGIDKIAPLEKISEFQISGYIDEPGYRVLREYAMRAQKNNLPRLGWIQGPILDCAYYSSFFSWLNSVRHYSAYQY